MSTAIAKAGIRVLNGIKNAISNPESTKEKWRTLISIIVGVVTGIVFIPILSISLPGILGKDFDDSDMSFSLEDTKMYQKVKEVYLYYNSNLDDKIQNRIAEIKKQYTYTTIVDKKPVKVVPEVIPNINLTKPRIELVLAYIAIESLEYQTKKDIYNFKKSEVKKFMEDITLYEEKISGSNPIYFTATTTVLNEMDIANKFFADEFDRQKYMISYESLCNEESQEITDMPYEGEDLDISTTYPNGMKVPHYLQYDSKWGANVYGNRNIRIAGCAPTSFAMVISYFNNQAITPNIVAAWSDSHGYYVKGVGTSWGFFSGASGYWGLKCNELGKNQKAVISALSTGKLVIASMSPGTFTKGGHFIVLRGITEDGKLLVNDPNDNFSTKNFYKREFAFSLVFNEAKAFWSFDK